MEEMVKTKEYELHKKKCRASFEAVINRIDRLDRADMAQNTIKAVCAYL